MNFAFIIPTLNRPTLARTIESLLPQLGAQDVVFVIADLKNKRKVKAPNDPRIYVLADRSIGARSYGYKARKYGIEMAAGASDYIHCIGDDDTYISGAIEKLRAALYYDAPRLPVLCKMRRNIPKERGGGSDVIWKDQNIDAGNNIAGEMFVFPNDPEKMGTFGEDYCGDNQFIRQTVAKHGGVIWSEIELCVWRA